MSAEQDTGSTDRRYENGWIGWIQIGAIIAVILIAAFITILLSGGSGGPPGGSPEQSTIPVRVVTPSEGSHAATITITGTVTATALVDISPQVGGRIDRLSESARAGASFEAGEVLFQIDPRDYRVAVTRAEAALADADASLQQTEADAAIARREWEAVYPDREITALAAREPQLAAARARKLAAEADLAQARLNLERTSASFPFDGRVTESRVEAGLLLVAGQRYGSVYDASTLEIVAPIAPSDLQRIGDATGVTARVTLEGGPRFEAQIARVGALLNSRTRFIDLFLAPGDAAPSLRPGQFAQIEISGPTATNVLTLPAEAAPSLDVVRIVQDGLIVERQVTVIDRPRGQIVVEPFDFGDGIIVSPVPEGGVGRSADILSTSSDER